MLNVLIDNANVAAEAWAYWTLATLLGSVAMLALAGLLWLAIRRRVAPQVGYCLFLLVPLKLLIPVHVAVPDSIARWTPPVLAQSWLPRNRGTETASNDNPREARPPADLVGQNRLASTSPSVKPAQSQPAAVDLQRFTDKAELASTRPIAAALSNQADAPALGPRLSPLAMLMCPWLAGVLMLLARFARTQMRFRRVLDQSTAIEPSRLAVDLNELCRLTNVHQSIRIVENDCVTAPAVWGIARPTIILPGGIARSLQTQQLRWVLLHELAHIRRRDLVVVAFQRLAAIVQFYNPAIWVANRVAHRLREYACDDLAVSVGHASGVESGEAFLQILRHSDRRLGGLQGALGVFGLDSKAACFLRIRRLLDDDRSIRIAPGAWSIALLILVAALALPHLRPARSETDAPQKDNTAKSQTEAQKTTDFDLRIVGPDGQPVPQARVHVRTSPVLSQSKIRRGKIVEKNAYSVALLADEEGRLSFELPPKSDGLVVYITTPGYGPYWASWSSERRDEPIPPSFTAQLDAGWSVGGIVVDAQHKPIAGVKVTPSIEFKKRPGDHSQLGTGDVVTTDAGGKWRFDSVPGSKSEVSVDINHPDFKGVQRELARGKFRIERGHEPVTEIVLERGLTVVGKVTDQAGQPISGALVRTKFLNDIREARTGADGSYKLAGCEPITTRVVVSAEGRATDVKELAIAPDIGPLDFQMKPGGTVRIRVLDSRGAPVPKARIFFQRWRGQFAYFEFAHVNQYADKNGLWVWHEAPLDEFAADICPPDGMELELQPLIARPEEYVFRTSPALVVSGKVVDAVTKAPIKKFRVVTGFRSPEKEMHYARNENYVASDGHYRLQRTRADFDIVRIEADGYQPANSRDIKSDEGTVSIDFALAAGKNVAGRVFTPENLPAKGADVALAVAGSQITIADGKFEDPVVYAARESTDETGRFHFPAQDKNFQILILHPSGFAHIKATPDWDLTKIIHLEPWARVEGIYRIGKAAAPNVPIQLYLSRLDGHGRDEPRFMVHYESVTGPDGRFTIERVVPGAGSIGRGMSLTEKDGSTEVTSSCTMTTEFPAGKTAQVALGGSGRAVVGKLVPPEGSKEKVRWNFALGTLNSPTRGPGGKGLDFTVTVAPDGTFRIDDVPAGSYMFSVYFQRDRAGLIHDRMVTVPKVEGEAAEKPLDLGTLTLEKP